MSCATLLESSSMRSLAAEDSSGLGRVFFLFFVAQACRCESNVNDFNSEKKDLELLREITASTIRLRLIYL